jgi:hypothetical protein
MAEQIILTYFIFLFVSVHNLLLFLISIIQVLFNLLCTMQSIYV